MWAFMMRAQFGGAAVGGLELGIAVVIGLFVTGVGFLAARNSI
jgi:hypothetical protein